MMDRRKNDQFIISLFSVFGAGLIIESIFAGWEFWVPPLILIGLIGLWWMHITGSPNPETREILGFGFGCFMLLFQGVHSAVFFDVSVVFALSMIAFSFINHVYMEYLLGIEYFIIMLIQLYLRYKAGGVFDGMFLSRILLHFAVIFGVALSCAKIIMERMEMEESDRKKDIRIEGYEQDTEDFFSNISHELRTPVNVVNGMSDLLIKRNAGDEAVSIKEAGIRLWNQIEDIQDYTESKRDKLLLEESEYMPTSLINDVVQTFRMNENGGDLELVVDLDPMVPARMQGDIKKLHKIFRHLLDNAVKFTREGGIYVRVHTERNDIGVNLCIEVTDTGIGIERRNISAVSEGLYQVNKKRDRSSGGIGLGLPVVFGFAHRMGGFVKIESMPNAGTTVRVTVPQIVVDETPCLRIGEDVSGDILFHVRSDKYKVVRVRDFYRRMAVNLASGMRLSLYSSETIPELERQMKKLHVSYIFMGVEEYEENSSYFDALAEGDVVVAVSAPENYRLKEGTRVMTMPKPLYAYPVIKILNEGLDATDLDREAPLEHPDLQGVTALVVDDEAMNLVVAVGLFREYGMEVETAGSGQEAIDKFYENDYDVIFMDHMMPEMDGVETMKRIREAGKRLQKKAVVIALTANVVSGAREMFVREGFDGFIAKPINLMDFEKVMLKVLRERRRVSGGEDR